MKSIANVVTKDKDDAPSQEENNPNDDLYIISDEYTIYMKENLGKGSFGQIYKCFNTQTKKEYAAKIESNTTTIPLLTHEYKMLKMLEGGEGIPTPIFFKNQGLDTILVIDNLGPNLEDILQDTKKKKFSLKTTLMIADQILTRLNYIHDLGIIHRDMKPENFLVPNHVRDTTIYIIDFGLARKYIDPKTNSHIPFREGRSITGTVRYISTNVHKGYEQSRRDDLLSLCYIICYFIRGELPWDSVKAKVKEEKYKEIFEIKQEYNAEKLSENFPIELKIFFEYVFQLEFETKPNYTYLKSLISKAIENTGNVNDMAFDWLFIELLEEPIFRINEIKKQKLLEKKKSSEEEDEQKKDNVTNKKNYTGSSNNIIKKVSESIQIGNDRRCKGSFHSSSIKKEIKNPLRSSLDVPKASFAKKRSCNIQSNCINNNKSNQK